MIRILILLKNLLKIPNGSFNISSSDNLLANMHDQLVQQLYNELALETLIFLMIKYLQSDEDKYKWDFLEFLSLIFENESATEVYNIAHNIHSDNQKKKNILGSILKQEKELNKQILKSIPTRHSRFGGTLIRKVEENIKSFVFTKVTGDTLDNLPKGKKTFKRNKLTVDDKPNLNITSDDTKVFLCKFAEELKSTSAFNCKNFF